MGSRDEQASEGWADVAELADAAEALFVAMRRARTSTASRSDGMTAAQVALLQPLLLEEESSTTGLAAAAGVALPTATRMLQQLERGGFVTRRRRPGDDRVVAVRLTERGAAVVDGVRQDLRDRQLRGLLSFSVAERAAFTDQLRRLAAEVSRADGRPHGGGAAEPERARA